MEVYIKNVMQQQGVSTKQLAERLNKSPQYVSNIVNGGKNLSMNTLQDVAAALGVPAWRLLAPDHVGERPSDGSSQVCPHCGHRLNIKIE